MKKKIKVITQRKMKRKLTTKDMRIFFQKMGLFIMDVLIQNIIR